MEGQSLLHASHVEYPNHEQLPMEKYNISMAMERPSGEQTSFQISKSQ
jgi:hypothetical protein